MSGILSVESLPAFRSCGKAERTRRQEQAFLIGLYVVACIVGCLIWQGFHDIGLSTLLTASVLVQCIAYCSLLISIMMKRSVAGVSGLCIQLQIASLVFRLSSTCWLKGYIPMDATGNWLYQVSDVTALVLCFQIGYCIYYKFRGTYNEEVDSWPVAATIGCCLVLACLIHPDLNNRPLFDAFWACGLYLDMVSTLPQVQLVGKVGNKLEALCAHYVALISVSRLLSGIFWSYGYTELEAVGSKLNVAGYAVLFAHVAHFIVMADFLLLYVRALIKNGGKPSQGELDLGGYEFII